MTVVELTSEQMVRMSPAEWNQFIVAALGRVADAQPNRMHEEQLWEEAWERWREGVIRGHRTTVGRIRAT